MLQEKGQRCLILEEEPISWNGIIHATRLECIDEPMGLTGQFPNSVGPLLRCMDCRNDLGPPVAEAAKALKDSTLGRNTGGVVRRED